METATNFRPSTRSFRENIFIVPLGLLVVTEISLRNDERSRVGRKFPLSLSSKSYFRRRKKSYFRRKKDKRMAVVSRKSLRCLYDALSLRAASSKVK